MPITENQKVRRQKAIGASDMAAVLGMDPWRSAYDVWLEKTGQVRGEQTKPWMETGKFFEAAVLRWAETLYGPLVRNQRRTYPKAYLASNTDALVKLDGVPVEGKTGGLFGPLTEVWGEPGTDQVPDRILIQCHVQMICTGKETCHVPAFLGGRGFVNFEIALDPQVAAVILAMAIEFWEKNVLQRIPPDNCLPSDELLKRIRREPNKVVAVDDAIVSAYIEAQQRASATDEVKDEASLQLRAALGDAEAGESNVARVEYFLGKSGRFDEKRFRADRPDIAAEYMKEPFRTLRIKKHKDKENAQ